MIYYSVGECYSKWKTGGDSCVLEYDADSGFSLFVMLSGLTEKEKEQFDANKSFAIGVCIYDAVAYVSFRFGVMPWMDAPFNPSIYAEVGKETSFPELASDEGFPLNVYLIDSAEGRLEKIRLIGLGHDFSEQFRIWANEENKNILPRTEYAARVKDAYDHFSSADFARMADWFWMNM